MFSRLKVKLNSLVISIYKNLTLLLFIILPNKVSKIFVSLSIVSLICNVRNIDIKEFNIKYDKFKTLLNVTFNEEIMLLPNYTVSWFWEDSFLNSPIILKDRKYTIKEVLQNDNLLYSNLKTIIEVLLEHIPTPLKLKLHINNTNKNLEIKHNVINLISYI